MNPCLDRLDPFLTADEGKDFFLFQINPSFKFVVINFHHPVEYYYVILLIHLGPRGIRLTIDA